MKFKNVVIVNDYDYVQGGASKVAIDTANLLVESNDNIKVYFFSACHDDNSNLDKKVINICTYQGEALKNKTKGFFNGIYNFKAARELKKLLSSLDKESTIVHFHGWTKALSSSVFNIVFKMKYYHVLTMHDYFTACPNGGYFNYKKNEICYLKPLSYKCIKCHCDSRNYMFKFYRIIRQVVQNKVVKLSKKLENVISISNFSQKILTKTLRKNINVFRVNNPIDFKKNVYIPKRRDDYFLYVGRISKEKGVDIFCEAITKENLKGIVVGDGDELGNLKIKYPKIDFVGWKDRSEIKNYMQKARALIFPSRLYEGAPLTIMEALYNGLPCIVSNNSAAIDMINENNGLIFDIKKNELRDKITEFIMNEKKYQNIQISHDNDYINNLCQVFNKILD